MCNKTSQILKQMVNKRNNIFSEALDRQCIQTHNNKLEKHLAFDVASYEHNW